jgi:hypothetical protein
MKLSGYSFILLAAALISACSSDPITKPLSLHPQNPHYFLFRGEPAILIGSTEHYGAVMNLDFDYIAYLNELAASGLHQFWRQTCLQVHTTLYGPIPEPAVKPMNLITAIMVVG